ncbi:siderophore-interacting protein [Brachybacterium sp. NBEC-018]|uniref:siderophore-interacting protein n=1 Tax=Brachybacterium sp. NBEC-018 TaxID=2996004 RepID=UPI0021751E32|nr:siderophore-interacting protein [Brachybacterium sp. NBEC-018]UVY84440.1 siderophore-interacting protein [Brachybacterium sp. NBEC-018]
MSQHELLIHPLVLRTLEVLEVREVTPRMRRVRLGGPELRRFRRDGLDLAGFTAPGFDDHVKLIFAPGADLAAALPRQLADGIEWTDAPERECRDYTPRALDLDEGWMDLDVVLHGDGPAATWAAHAAPGEQVALVGPKSSMVLPAGTTGVLLVGDETALPAIGRYFDERPLPVPAHALVVIEDPAARQELALREGDSVRFVRQDPADGEALLDAVRARVAELGGIAALGARPFVWAAGESRALLPLRRWATRENALPRTQLAITGYWTVGADEGDAEGTGAATPPSPVAWFAVRAALELGVLDALRERPARAEDLAAQVGADARQLAVLLDVLQEQGLVEDGALTARGRELVDDEHAREQLEGLDAERLVALAELPQALRGGGTAWRRRNGRSFAETLRGTPAWEEEVAEEAGSLRYLQHGLLRALDSLPGASSPQGRLALVGRGAPVVADMLGDRAALTTGPAEAVVSVLELHLLEDEEAVAHLRELRAVAPEALVVAAARPDALGGSAAARALLDVAVTGAAPRDGRAVELLARRAGWGGVGTSELGWGMCAFRLLPA